jgi:cell division protein FtsB
MESAPERWLRNIRLSGFTLTVLFLVILAVVVLAPSLKLLVEQQQEMAALEVEVGEQRDSVNNLEDEVARWSDPAYIEAEARDRLLYVYPGEYSYLVIDGTTTATTADGAPISDSIQTTQVDWINSMLGSVLTAGLSTDVADDIVPPVIEDPQ